MKPRVFVANEPLRKEYGTGRWIRYLDLKPAESFGDLVFLLDGRPDPDAKSMIPALRKKLNSLTPQDYLVLAGSPALVAWTVVVAFEVCPQVRLLDWDKAARKYNVLPLNIPKGVAHDPNRIH